MTCRIFAVGISQAPIWMLSLFAGFLIMDGIINLLLSPFKLQMDLTSMKFLDAYCRF